MFRVLHCSLDNQITNLHFQLCPDQPCGAASAIVGATLSPASVELQNPCLAFSIGDDGDAAANKKPKNNNDCLRDYISIGGKM